MKKIFVIASVLLMGTMGVQAQVYFSADFSAAEGYTDGPLIGQPATGAVQWVNLNPDVATDDITVQNGQLVIEDVTTGGRWFAIEIPVQLDVFYVSWDWQFVGAADGTIDVGICLSDDVNFELVDGNPIPNFNEQGTMIRMYQAGLIDARNGDWDGGGDYSAMADFSYQDGKKFTVRMEVDPSPSQWMFDVFVQKEGEEEVQLADDYGFRRLASVETDGLNTLTIWDNSVDGTLGNAVILDNFVIYGSTSVSDWSVF